MFNKNGKIQVEKRTFGNGVNKFVHAAFSVVTYYVVSYYRFLNTDPAKQDCKKFSVAVLFN
jgi:hypothetical protein